MTNQVNIERHEAMTIIGLIVREARQDIRDGFLNTAGGHLNTARLFLPLVADKYRDTYEGWVAEAQWELELARTEEEENVQQIDSINA